VTAVWLAAPPEAADVTRLLVSFRDWIGSAHPPEQEMAASVERLLGDRDAEFLLGSVAAGAPSSGVCQLRYRHSVWTSAPDCWLEDLFVEERARGRGLGRALALSAIDRARARGAHRIELDTHEDNPAVALYESLGFSMFSKAPAGLRGRGILMGRPVP
jgi:GNAT superfamily N-acetyltransferase